MNTCIEKIAAKSNFLDFFIDSTNVLFVHENMSFLDKKLKIDEKFIKRKKIKKQSK